MNRKLLYKGILSIAFLFLFILFVPGKSYSVGFVIEEFPKDSTKNVRTSYSVSPNTKAVITSASQISDQEAIDYICDIWNLVYYMDETIREELAADGLVEQLSLRVNNSKLL